MKLISVKLKNFRSYKEETIIDLDDLTVFVGKNDIGKSTVLEALDVFFNDGKGDYKKEYGGSKSGYQKGVTDTLKAVGIMFVSLASMITIVSITKKK